MKQSLKQVLDIEKDKIAPEKEQIDKINKILKEFISKFEKELKTNRIKADVFVGGSFVKGTVIRKNKYDVDIFVRFDKREKEISEIAEKILNKIDKNVQRIHGSRDYFQIKYQDGLIFEIIPVLKVSRPKDAENITDLSYFHVNYVKKYIKKDKRLVDEIRLAKAFCHAQKCYGAESYIQGFSGYALELLIINYGSFEKFLRGVLRAKDKIVLFDKKQFKSRQEVLMNVNQSKLGSPVVFIDPTYKERNALAALSDETFEDFKIKATAFLKSPSLAFFEDKKIDWDKVKKKYRDKEFIVVKISTNRQEGDIAGSKLLKFYNFFKQGCVGQFIVKKSDFEYDEKQDASFYILAEKKKDSIIRGPPIVMNANVALFKRQHKITFEKNKFIYARKDVDINLKTFSENWKKKNSRTLSEMGIIYFEVIA